MIEETSESTLYPDDTSLSDSERTFSDSEDSVDRNINAETQTSQILTSESFAQPNSNHSVTSSDHVYQTHASEVLSSLSRTIRCLFPSTHGHNDNSSNLHANNLNSVSEQIGSEREQNETESESAARSNFNRVAESNNLNNQIIQGQIHPHVGTLQTLSRSLRSPTRARISNYNSTDYNNSFPGTDRLPSSAIQVSPSHLLSQSSSTNNTSSFANATGPNSPRMQFRLLNSHRPDVSRTSTNISATRPRQQASTRYGQVTEDSEEVAEAGIESVNNEHVEVHMNQRARTRIAFDRLHSAARVARDETIDDASANGTSLRQVFRTNRSSAFQSQVSFYDQIYGSTNEPHIRRMRNFIGRRRNTREGQTQTQALHGLSSSGSANARDNESFSILSIEPITAVKLMHTLLFVGQMYSVLIIWIAYILFETLPFYKNGVIYGLSKYPFYCLFHIQISIYGLYQLFQIPLRIDLWEQLKSADKYVSLLNSQGMDSSNLSTQAATQRQQERNHYRDLLRTELQRIEDSYSWSINQKMATFMYLNFLLLFFSLFFYRFWGESFEDTGFAYSQVFPTSTEFNLAYLRSENVDISIHTIDSINLNTTLSYFETFARFSTPMRGLKFSGQKLSGYGLSVSQARNLDIIDYRLTIGMCYCILGLFLFRFFSTILLSAYFFWHAFGAEYDLTETSAKKFPVVKYCETETAKEDKAKEKESNGSENEERNCVICLVGLKDRDKVVVLPCSKMHIFHQKCIRTWFQKSKFCPLCMADVTQINNSEETNTAMGIANNDPQNIDLNDLPLLATTPNSSDMPALDASPIASGVGR